MRWICVCVRERYGCARLLDTFLTELLTQRECCDCDLTWCGYMMNCLLQVKNHTEVGFEMVDTPVEYRQRLSDALHDGMKKLESFPKEGPVNILVGEHTHCTVSTDYSHPLFFSRTPPPGLKSMWRSSEGASFSDLTSAACCCCSCFVLRVTVDRSRQRTRFDPPIWWNDC